MNEQTVAMGALGRIINPSDRRIQQLVKEGVLERHEKGRYPFLSNVRAYVIYLQARADGGGTVIDLEDARKRKLGAEARLAEIELKKAEEQIISVDSHAEVIGKIGDLVRGRLTAIPSKTAPSLALEQKQVVCKEIVDMISENAYQSLPESSVTTSTLMARKARMKQARRFLPPPKLSVSEWADQE